MSTLKVKKEDGWVIASAVSCNYQNDSEFPIRYEFSNDKPTGKGMSMPAGWLDAVELSGSTLMWIKNPNETTVFFEVTSWVQ